MVEKGDLFISGEEMDQYFANLYLDELEDNEEIQMLFEEAVEEVCVQTIFLILCYLPYKLRCLIGLCKNEIFAK